MTTIRYLLLLTVATPATVYAVASWMCGLLLDAGVSAALGSAAVLVAEGIGYCQRRSWERARRVRQEVWARREAECMGAVWPSEVGGFE